jgi:hypothetical protein
MAEPEGERFVAARRVMQAAVQLIPKSTPILCQPEDEVRIQGDGFTEVMPVENAIEWGGIGIERTAGRHRTEEIGRRMAPVSNFVLRAEVEPALYVAADTIFCPEVEEALRRHRPDVTVLNAAGERCRAHDSPAKDVTNLQGRRVIGV